MVKVEFNKGECMINTNGSNFEIMVETSVIIEEITRGMLSDCKESIKPSIVNMFKDSINYAIDCGAK